MEAKMMEKAAVNQRKMTDVLMLGSKMLEAKKAAPRKRRKAAAKRAGVINPDMKGSILQYLSNFNCKGSGTNQDESSKLPYGGGKRKVEEEDDLDHALEDVLGTRKSRRMMTIERT